MMTIRRNLEYECLCQMINKLIEQLTSRLSKTCQYALFFCFVLFFWDIYSSSSPSK